MGRVSRRDVLEKCLASGLLVLASPLTELDVWAAWQTPAPSGLKVTPPNVLGPFYKRNAPARTTLVPHGQPGLPLTVSGRVLDISGNVVPGASIEIWQADHSGHYDLDGYMGRGQFTTGTNGAYGFGTVMPGHYPTRKAQHIHYLVKAEGYKPLVTQLYFATDHAFGGDPARNYTADPLVGNPELIRPVQLHGDTATLSATVTFELCLQKR
jgi:protocatechuate 3,4-dioxygenase beta subunit